MTDSVSKREKQRQSITDNLILKLKPQAKAYEITDKRLPGFTVRVEPTGKKTFYARFTLRNGERGRIKIGAADVLLAASARDEARDYIAKAMLGEDPRGEKQLARAATLRTYLKERYKPWADVHLKSGDRMVNRITASFVDLLDKPLHEIRPAWVMNWRTRRMAAGTAKGTVNRDIAALRGLLSRAVEDGTLKENPLRTVKMLRETDSAKIRYLDPHEKDDDGKGEPERLMAALDKRELRLRTSRASANEWRQQRGYPLLSEVTGTFADHLKPMVLLSLNTGLRRGELFHLVWSDVNFAMARLHVRSESAKAQKQRHIPLNDRAIGALRAWQEQTGGKGDALVFPSEDGKPFDNVRKAWAGVLKEAKITNFRWHDMRHDFASKLVMAGVDLNTVRELLGHSDLKMTLRYAHLAPEHKAEAVARLA